MNQKIDALLAGHRKFIFAPTAGGGGPETEDIRARMALVAVTRAPPGQTQRTAARVPPVDYGDKLPPMPVVHFCAAAWSGPLGSDSFRRRF